MNKRLAVLLLRVAGAPDLPTKDYAEKLFTNAGRGTRNLVDYYDEVSHGWLDIGPSRVFDWIDYGHTRQDLVDFANKAKAAHKQALIDGGAPEAAAEKAAAELWNGWFRGKTVEWAKEAAAAARLAAAQQQRDDFNIDGFDVLVCVFNQGVDYWATTGVVVLNWNPPNLSAFSIDLTGVAHEVGHGLGMEHSRMEGSTEEYGDVWDIMSAYDTIKLTKSAEPTAATPYYTYGPGLNAANMDMAGWLDQTRLYTAGDDRSFTFRLRPLHRRDLSGWLAAKLTLGSETYYVEYRARDRWDRSVLEPCVLLHRRGVHPDTGRACSYLVVASSDLTSPRPELRDGESYTVGDVADLLGGYYKLTVTIDDASLLATINVRVRHARQLQSGTPLFGVDVGAGGLVYVPGRGLVKVPPHSPLLRVVGRVAEHEILQALEQPATPEVSRLSLEQLVAARDQLSAMIVARSSGKAPMPMSVRSSDGAPGPDGPQDGLSECVARGQGD